ncbi:MAG: hypothetical protein II347_03695 [Lachnospiraceae bacterium]|nr:hypothetical protein [Lachnospiraceae bacterium]
MVHHPMDRGQLFGSDFGGRRITDAAGFFCGWNHDGSHRCLVYGDDIGLRHRSGDGQYRQPLERILARW